MTETPIFVTGFKRSGTTLLGNILDRHPRVGIFVESFFIPRYYFTQLFYWPLRRRGNLERLAKEIASEVSSRKNGLRYDPGVLDSLSTRTYPALLDALMSTWARERGKARWGDKSPGYISKLRVLDRMYSEARYVHIVRDGRAVWRSLKKLNWESDVAKVAREWRKSIVSARSYAARHLGGRYVEVRYEDLVQSPEREISRIIDFLGEEYAEELLSPDWKPSRNEAFKEWPKIHSQINRSSLQAWRQDLSEKEIQLFEAQAGRLLEELGYPLLFDLIPLGVRMESRLRTVGAVVERGRDVVRRRAGMVVGALAGRIAGPRR